MHSGTAVDRRDRLRWRARQLFSMTPRVTAVLATVALTGTLVVAAPAWADDLPAGPTATTSADAKTAWIEAARGVEELNQAVLTAQQQVTDRQAAAAAAQAAADATLAAVTAADAQVAAADAGGRRLQAHAGRLRQRQPQGRPAQLALVAADRRLGRRLPRPGRRAGPGRRRHPGHDGRRAAGRGRRRRRQGRRRRRPRRRPSRPPPTPPRAVAAAQQAAADVAGPAGHHAAGRSCSLRAALHSLCPWPSAARPSRTSRTPTCRPRRRSRSMPRPPPRAAAGITDEQPQRDVGSGRAGHRRRHRRRRRADPPRACPTSGVPSARTSSTAPV